MAQLRGVRASLRGAHGHRVPLEAFGLDGLERERYGPSGWLTLYRILPRREVGTGDVFIDLGSGMGRVLLQVAVRYRLRRVIGVELSDAPNEVARANIERNRHRLLTQHVELVTADVLEYELPDDVTIVFLGNPFSGETLQVVLERLVTSVQRAPRGVRIIYRTPVEEERLLAFPEVQRVRAVRGWRPGAEWSMWNATRMYEVRPVLPASTHS